MVRSLLCSLFLGAVLGACSEPAPPRSEGADDPRESAPMPLPREPAPTMSWRGADWLVRPERVAEENPEAMLDALRIEAGDAVADIGAGIGFHSLRLAERVGPEGRVYATDIQAEMLERLMERARAAGVDNVVPVEASQTGTGLPRDAITLALMVDVYHELSEPRSVLDDLAGALRAEDGRLALVEFRAEDPDVPIREAHKMSATQMIAELEAAGWSLDRRFDELPWQHLMLFRPPAAPEE